jgi:transposase InsO family protein
MRLMGLVAIYQRPNTSKPTSENKVYPYLLGGLSIARVNQVWCTDITYIPMAKGFLYLVVVMDWLSRAVLAWRLSNTLGADFCVEALEEALAQHGKPEIFNTDQGCQFTSTEFTGVLERGGYLVRISKRLRIAPLRQKSAQSRLDQRGYPLSDPLTGGLGRQRWNAAVGRRLLRGQCSGANLDLSELISEGLSAYGGLLSFPGGKGG